MQECGQNRLSRHSRNSPWREGARLGSPRRWARLRAAPSSARPIGLESSSMGGCAPGSQKSRALRRLRRRSLGSESGRCAASGASEPSRRWKRLAGSRRPARKAEFASFPAPADGQAVGTSKWRRSAKCSGSGSRTSARPSADGRSEIPCRTTSSFAVFRSQGGARTAPATVGWSIGGRETAKRSSSPDADGRRSPEAFRLVTEIRRPTAFPRRRGA